MGERLKVYRRTKPPPKDRKDAILWAHELTGALWITLPSGVSSLVDSGGGGGTLNHAALTSNLAWLSSAHVLSGTYKLAGSAGSAAAAEVAYTTFTATLLDDPDAATARTTLGAAYVSRSISTTSPLMGGGDLSADRTLSITTADATHAGALLAADWVTFNAKEPAITAGTTSQYWRGDKSWQTLDKAAVGLGNVENTALSTWAGSTNVVTVGTVITGVWHGTAIGMSYLSLTYGTTASTVCEGNDARLSDKRTANAIYETGGPTTLTVGAIAAGELLIRSGSTVIGAAIGVVVQAYSAILAGVVALAGTTGLVAKTGASSFVARTITAGSGTTVTNGDGVSGNPTIAVSGSGGTLGTAAAVTTYGGAFDGDVTFDTGAAAPTGWTLASSTFTRDAVLGECQYKTVTFAQNSITLDVAGCPFRCRSFNPTAKDSIAVVNVGTAGATGVSGGAGGSGASPATIATSSAGSVFYGGTNGGNGSAGANGVAGTSAPAGTGYGGGGGGKGGGARSTVAATIRAGGAGGGGTNAGTKPHFYGSPWAMISGGLLAWRNGTGLLQIAGGTGGGGGGGSGGASLKGGGGSGAGGVLLFAAETAAFGTGCYFSVDGVTGGLGYIVATTDTAGGGGGSGAGRMMVAIGTITGSNLPSFYGRGGAGGAGAIGATGYWAEGGTGGDGGKLEIYVGTNSVGGTPTVTVTGGAAGTNFGGGTGYVGSAAGTAGTYKYGEGA
jgi:hypothetical protein